MSKLTQLKDKAVAFYQAKKRVVLMSLASLGVIAVAPAAMAAEPTFTPGSSAITSAMLQPVVDSITSTIGTVSTSAFLVLGFGLSVYIGFKIIKGMFKTAAQ
ncbi:hypothetical protein I4T90_002116 [Salmonella enterica subsp. enterica serovar Panama]|uniref:Phage coat protein n=1 Tax=Salmonella enterica subsp. enterica serovar Panama TaxID=29472 RepID=A0A751YSI8_SALET|nr:hypothetical protein [Salmonella enterica subsp. enterica serovar Sandiego]EBR3742796.1 hypothetical protein [Salmonella enterica]EGS7286545.1 hypothetical protein [Salmonella enterica subsp. enterica serovar Panama]EGS7544446.1 hypothetical protein [Salmonella enterica subsp. enterica serovar Panama]EHC9770541.1 hypothetical protein [Salmonella enterica subsp. enterica serovar Panama]